MDSGIQNDMKSGITLHYNQIDSKDVFSSASDMLILC